MKGVAYVKKYISEDIKRLLFEFHIYWEKLKWICAYFLHR